MRATASIDASVLEILAVLQDSPRRIEWMARCVESVEIQRIDLFNGLYYSRMAAWPFDDRDVVVAIETSVGNDASSATVRMVSVESELMGPVEGVVRMPAFAGHYRLTQLDTAGSPSTLVEYELAIEFGGGLSGRIAQLAREDIPFETLLNLRTHVPDTRDEYAKLVARWRKDLPSLLAKSAAARQTDAPVESADPTVGAGAPRETPAE